MSLSLRRTVQPPPFGLIWQTVTRHRAKGKQASTTNPSSPVPSLVLSRRIPRGGDFSGLPQNISATLARTVGTLQLVAETGNHLYGGWW